MQGGSGMVKKLCRKGRNGEQDVVCNWFMALAYRCRSPERI